MMTTTDTLEMLANLATRLARDIDAKAAPLLTQPQDTPNHQHQYAMHALRECERKHRKALQAKLDAHEEAHQKTMHDLEERFREQCAALRAKHEQVVRRDTGYHLEQLERFAKALCRDVERGGGAEPASAGPVAAPDVEHSTWRGRQGRTWKELSHSVAALESLPDAKPAMPSSSDSSSDSADGDLG
jgi:hypothetical protein